jgi:lon-related putative ATP-dependent protease
MTQESRMPVSELSPRELRAEAEPLECRTSGELAPLEGVIGQDRALRALNFGLGMREKGFNLYVAGPPGTGKTTAVRNFLEGIAKSRPAPPDLCYVNNFRNAYEPIYIQLPTGRARTFQKDVDTFIEETRRAVPRTLQSDEFQSKREALLKTAEERRHKILSDLGREAERSGFSIQATALGIMLVPIIDGRPVSDEELAALPDRVKREIDEKRENIESKFSEAMKQTAVLDKEARASLRKLTSDAVEYAIGFLTDTLAKAYEDIPEVMAYLKDAKADILENLESFVGVQEPPTSQAQMLAPWAKDLPFRRYKVNVIVDNSQVKGAPVIFEENPTYTNLFGRIEKEAQFGSFTTDFTLVKGGSMHKANGGYLVIRVEELLGNMLSYDGLKRALRNNRIVIEEAGERLGFISTKSLTPQPIPLDVKVILVGNPLVYQILYAYDPEFREFFKVKADFDTTIERSKENMQRYASFVCTLCVKEGLRHLESSAIAKVVEYGSRLADDQRKLSTRFAEIADLIREANYYATQEGSEYINADHILRALDEKVYRSNLIQQKILEMTQRGLILIDTSGTKVAQVNGLSVISLGDFAFGRPSRVTASIGLGREGVIDIEREAKMGGPIHTKGVLILGGYLANKYAQDKPLSLSARLVFEQSYEGVEGDSASSTELYAILSALADLPVKQNIAVTGSVNQKGEVQAIGGVNEKIEGFYELCKARGLKGDESVMIPKSNVQDLMLKEEVVKTVADGRFHIYPVSTIDEGIEVLTGAKAGQRRKGRSFEPNTVNYRVDHRLRQMAEAMAKFPEAAPHRRTSSRRKNDE